MKASILDVFRANRGKPETPGFPDATYAIAIRIEWGMRIDLREKVGFLILDPRCAHVETLRRP